CSCLSAASLPTRRSSDLKAGRLARITYDELPALLDIRAALAAGSYVVPSRALVRGTPATVLAAAPHRLKGTVVIGGQDHFYLERSEEHTSELQSLRHLVC